MSNETYEDLDGTLTPASNAGNEPPNPQDPPLDLAPDPNEPLALTPEEIAAKEAEEQAKAALAEEHKKKTGSQRQRERAERLERENQALRDALARGKQPEMPVQTEPTSKPNPDDPKWTSHAEFEEARIAYEVERRIEEREQKRRMKDQQEGWAKKEEPVAAKYDDYPEVFQDFIASKPSQFLTQAILKAEEGPEIAYYLGNNPQELRRINAMEPVDQVLAVGDIRARFKQPTVKKDVKPTKAPDPISPLTGAAKPVQRDDRQDRYEQY